MQFFLTWVWAAIPVWIAAQAPYGAGDYAWVPVVAFSGLAAPIGLWVAAAVRHPLWKMVGLFVGLIAATWNIATAVGSSAEHRQVRAEPDKLRIEQRESLVRRDAFLENRISTIGWRLNGQTSHAIRARVSELKTTAHYLRTDGCRNLKALDPERVCATIEVETGRLAEAETVERHQDEREAIRQQLLKVAGPQSADVQVETIRRLLANFIDIDTAMITALLSGLGPLVWELIGTLLPAAISQWFREQNESATAEGSEDAEDLRRVSSDPPATLRNNLENSLPSLAEDDPPTLRKPSADEGFERWNAEHVEESAEDSLQARPTFLHYSAWCLREGVEALSERTFSTRMEGAGHSKQKLGRGAMHYIGIRLKPTKLKVVK